MMSRHALSPSRKHADAVDEAMRTRNTTIVNAVRPSSTLPASEAETRAAGSRLLLPLTKRRTPWQLLDPVERQQRLRDMRDRQQRQVHQDLLRMPLQSRW